MPLATLEEIRLLSNLETKHHKLLQMVLFGQPELDINLNQTQIRQLRERITHSFNLTPLRPKEVGEYLIFRLRAAGYFGPHLFTDKSIAHIAGAAEGLIRRVNILADKALLAAFADNVYQVTPKHVKAAIADSEFGAEKAKKVGRQLWFLGLVGVLLLGLALGYLGQWLYQAKVAKPASSALAESTNAPTTVALQAKPAPALPPAVASVADAPLSTEQVAPSDNALSASASQVMATAQDILQARLSATQLWMQAQPKDTVTIQILGASDEQQLRLQLASLAQTIELDKIFVYQTKANQLVIYTVVYGTYADRFSANEALKRLPESLQKNRPQLRTIGGILEETNKSA
jgi:hypothetical protein